MTLLQQNIPDTSKIVKNTNSVFHFFDNSDYNNIVLGVIGSIIAALIGFGVTKLINFLLSKRFTLTGKWEQQIEEGGKVIKRDLIRISQRGVKVKAESERIFPENQKNKKWNFSGRFQNDHLYGFYYSDNNLSCGTINLILSNEDILLGFTIKHPMMYQP